MAQRILGLVLVAMTMMVGISGCSSDADEVEDGESVAVSQELLQGGCSMSEIRGWQRACRAAYGDTRGIHYCYPGMSLRHMNCEGACACN
jgi:hypothetical protein